MSRKDFIALADAIKAHNNGANKEPFTGSQLETLASFCASQNPRFNAPRWFGYIKGICDKGGGKV